MSAEQLWVAMARGQDRSPRALALKWGLTPLETLYRAGLAVYHTFEPLGLRKRTRLDSRVVSIGNLTVGGTGKTGVVQSVAEQLAGRVRLAVLLRGYGSHGSPCTIASDGRQLLAGWREAGDEAVLLAEAVPEACVLAGKDRRVTGAVAADELGCRLVLLDDGLQYWQLHRDLDIVLVDARCPFGNGRLLPAGMLREPVGTLRKAGAVVLTHANDLAPSAVEALENGVRRSAPDARIFRGWYKPSSVRLAGGQTHPAEWLVGRRVYVTAAIGSPDAFASTVAGAGAKLCGSAFFPDHHPMSEGDLAGVATAASEVGAELIVTTQKDFVKLEGLKLPENLAVLTSDMHIDNMQELIDLVWPPG